ncbi:SpoIIE family protein phosphatase [Streptomyces sp. NPDC013978]|uniref:ATP-binding SpoIIE family protein phosphatase n=1 Tax=Streptomyces sp. NPDC013978 TaxID=3364869 RepID=UPI0037007A42
MAIPDTTAHSTSGILGGNPYSPLTAAVALLDRDGKVVGWTSAAADEYGFDEDWTRGRPLSELVGRARGRLLLTPHLRGSRQHGWCETREVHHRDGRTVHSMLHLCPLIANNSDVSWLVVLVPSDRLQQWATDQAMLTGLFTQSAIALTVYGPDMRVAWVNAAVEAQHGLRPEEWVGRYITDMFPQGEILSPEYRGRALEDVIAQVFHSGTPVLDLHYRSPTSVDPAHLRVWSCSYFRLQDGGGRALGVCESAFDITDRYEARRRLALLSRASSIGRHLDASRTAEELAAVLVPEFADMVRVELAENVLAAGDAAPLAPGGQPYPLRCVVERTADERVAVQAYPSQSPEGRLRLVLPLRAGDTLLGRVTLERFAPRDPYGEEEHALAMELVSHTAVCVDNARRYAREHVAALTLQRNLLPAALPEPTGVEIAHHYSPAADPKGVGGDWYDVIPLSGARVGLVVGDVSGHGLNAAATMGRLRTTVRALAALDLDPGELLTRLGDLVAQARIGIHSVEGDPPEDQAIGARCLYAVYDPASGHCSMASAGHLPPIVTRPDGTVEALDMAIGPPLGTDPLPFECTDLELPAGSMLALFTDGLIQRPDSDLDSGLAELRRVLGRRGMTPAEARSAIVARLPAGAARDDTALLLVRVHRLSEPHMASWPIPADTAEVAAARNLATHQLTEWGLDDVAFVVELVVSELVTNAIRYGGAPVCLRLLRDRDRTLICEVSDGGHTSPHLRRAGLDDEGGRGLFMVAQLTERWGTRYARDGKTIWTEVPLRMTSLEAP